MPSGEGFPRPMLHLETKRRLTQVGEGNSQPKPPKTTETYNQQNDATKPNPNHDA